MEIKQETSTSISNPSPSKSKNKNSKGKALKRGLNIEGYQIEGISIAGHETCVIIPTLNLAFDIGKCPQRAVSQQFVFISHGHMDHIGGLPMYVATRGLYRMTPPTIIVPKAVKECVEKIFEAHRAMDQSELKHTLIALDVGEEICLRKDLKVRAFRTYHVIPSQGYIVYSIKHKLKQEYIGLPAEEIKKLKSSCVEITNTVTTPEIAFTGDTMSDFILDNDNIDVLRARILIVESTYVEETMTAEEAREYGHTHLSEVVTISLNGYISSSPLMKNIDCCFLQLLTDSKACGQIRKQSYTSNPLFGSLSTRCNSRIYLYIASTFGRKSFCPYRRFLMF